MTKRKLPPSSLQHNLVVPLTPTTRKLVTRLSKTSLTALALRWLDPKNVHLHSFNLKGHDDNDEDESSLAEVTEAYSEFARNSRVRGKDVAERMLEYEWRDGLTLLEIAELEWQYLLDKPNSSKWAALLLAPLTTNPVTATARPRFHTPTFLASFQASLVPAQTAHYYVARHPSLPLTLIRVSLHDPHTAAPLYPERKRIFWLGFPVGGDHIFTTFGNTQRGGGAREVVLSGVAHAVSRSGCRFELKPGRLQARTLESMCSLRGAEGASGGMAAGWGVYVDGFEDSPLAPPKDKSDGQEGEEGEEEEMLDPQARKRRKLVKTRFGNTGIKDGAALESAYFEVVEKFPEDPDLAREERQQEESDDEEGTFVPKLGIKFDGPHIFAGIREMAEEGEGIDVMTLPGWMTGEEAVSSGVVRNGKVIRKKGAGRFSKV